MPEKDPVLAPDIALCEECPRRDSKPDKIAIKEFRRPHQIEIDTEKCLLAQGLLCMGICTRKGCGAVCIKGNMPCTGCMGPVSHISDHGTKALSAFASLIDSNDEEEIAHIIDNVVDPIGTFYRYSLPASLMHRSHAKTNGKGE